ncbi:hypothetical protein [Nonomuraea sp. NPDC049625]|uniref:hypothetical protein n=1 Tax=Nonomuraea sp. NPDC049625 TaxID=3155775 RepID=UPI0034241964
MSPTIRTVLVPDLNNDLWHVLNELEELLLTYAVRENTDQVEPGELPAPLTERRRAGGTATTSDRPRAHAGRARHQEAGTTGRLLAPDGRYEFAPLRLVDVDQAGVQVLSAAARALGARTRTSSCACAWRTAA